MIRLLFREDSKKKFARFVAVVGARDDHVVARWDAKTLRHFASVDVRAARADPFQLRHVHFQSTLLEILLHVDAVFDLEAEKRKREMRQGGRVVKALDLRSNSQS